MKTFLRSLWPVISMLALATSAFANSTLSLDQIRKKVLESNRPLKIQFENYQQAQLGIYLAQAQLPPAFKLHLLNVGTTQAINHINMPAPIQWFDFQQNQSLSNAEKHISQAIKLNMLEGLINNFISIKHHQSLLVSYQEEETVLEKTLQDANLGVELGQIDADVPSIIKRDLLQHRQLLFQLQRLIEQEKELLSLSLGLKPSESLILAELSAELLVGIPSDIKAATEQALNRSTELFASKLIQQAANLYSRTDRTILSFHGVGFEYSNLIEVERSNSGEIDSLNVRLKSEIEKQVVSAFEDLDLLQERIDLQKQVIEGSSQMQQRQAEMLQAGQLNLSVYLTTQRSLLAEVRGLSTLENERRIKVNNLRRLLAYNLELPGRTVSTTPSNPPSSSAIEEFHLLVKTSRLSFGRSLVTLSLQGQVNSIKKIQSVVYSIDGMVRSARISRKASQFRYSFKIRRSGTFKVTSRITMSDGRILLRTGNLRIN